MKNRSADPKASPAQAAGTESRFFANPVCPSGTQRNAGYIASNDADLARILETVKVIDEGDAQSWYTAWKATADLVLALSERTQDSPNNSGASMRASA
jgi:hypothetical protein